MDVSCRWFFLKSTFCLLLFFLQARSARKKRKTVSFSVPETNSITAVKCLDYFLVNFYLLCLYFSGVKSFSEPIDFFADFNRSCSLSCKFITNVFCLFKQLFVLLLLSTLWFLLIKSISPVKLYICLFRLVHDVAFMYFHLEMSC